MKLSEKLLSSLLTYHKALPLKGLKVLGLGTLGAVMLSGCFSSTDTLSNANSAEVDLTLPPTVVNLSQVQTLSALSHNSQEQKSAQSAQEAQSANGAQSASADESASTSANAASNNSAAAIAAISKAAAPTPLSYEEWSKLTIKERAQYDKNMARALIAYQNIEYAGQFTPYTGSGAQIYGSPANGCIASAARLSDKGRDFQLQRWGDNRNHGHPIMLNYLADLRERTKKAGLPPLLIGDMSLPQGGPLPHSSHASHTNGLDVDLPFDFALPRKSEAELKKPKDVYIVRGNKIQPEFNASISTYIKIAVSDPRVERVFVAPMIKKQMCNLYEGKPGDGFLHKLRPWFGHQAHMHIRLKCPIDSPDCVGQAPIPEGSGCGYELDSWINPPKMSDTAKKTPAKPKPKRVLPEQCQILLKKK